MSLNSTQSENAQISIIPEAEDERKIDVLRYSGLLVIVAAIGLIANWIATGTDPLTALPGMAILFAVSVAGLALARFSPFYLPSVAWISMLAIIVTIPGFPGAAYASEKVADLNFLALATPALAYGGLALSQNEFLIAKRSGWKIVVVAICVMFGTYIGSVVIADLTLRITG